MSCSLNGQPCNNGMDCFSNDPNCTNLLCNTSGKCQSTTCTQDCSQFGDGFTCVNGQCSSIGCGSSDDCPSGMACGPNKKCTSQTCNGILCPGGYQCKSMAGGDRVCVANPGIRWRSFIPWSFGLLILVIIVILVTVKRHDISNFINKQ